MLYQAFITSAALLPFTLSSAVLPRNGDNHPADFCLTRNPSPAQQAETAKQILGSSARRAGPIEVPLHIHGAVAADAGPEVVSIETLNKQFEVMRDIYAKYDITLTKGNITRDNSGRYTRFQWDSDSQGYFKGTSPELEEYWRETRTGGYDELHVYFYQDIDNFGGLCIFPDLIQALEGPPFWHDGCHLHSDLLVDSYDPYYSQGKVAVHESGHWFGLLHVFQGTDYAEGCSGPGDGIDDTAPQSSPTRDCPVGKDSCPETPGLDNVHNYMDYSSNKCMTEFTDGQKERMHNVFNALRRGW